MTLTGELCLCGHDKKYHRRNDKKAETVECVATLPGTFIFCKCTNFRAAATGASQTTIEENGKMAKNGKTKAAKEPRVKKERKPKGEGRKPTLAPFVDSPFKIYASTGGKEYEAQVLSTGIIKMDEKEYTSPSAAGSALLGKDSKGKPRQVDGWAFWKMNKDGKRVPLDDLRGAKSPLKEAAA